MNHSCAAEEVSLSFTFSWSRRSEVVFDGNMFSLTFDPSAKYTGTEELQRQWGRRGGKQVKIQVTHERLDVFGVIKEYRHRLASYPGHLHMVCGLGMRLTHTGNQT